MPPTLRRLCAEPLIHFALLGALLVALLQLGTSDADPRPVVTVDAEALALAEDVWRAEHQRDPDPDERAALLAELEAEALLLAEARALRLDQADPEVRRRLADLAVLTLVGDVEIPEEAELRAWFEADRERWAEPARVIIELRTAPDAPPRSLGPVDRAELVAACGEAVAEAAFDPDADASWSDPIPAPDGQLQLRVALHLDALEPDFEQLRFVAADTWQRERFEAKRTAAVAQLRQRYRVEAPAP